MVVLMYFSECVICNKVTLKERELHLGDSAQTLSTRYSTRLFGQKKRENITLIEN